MDGAQSATSLVAAISSFRLESLTIAPLALALSAFIISSDTLNVVRMNGWFYVAAVYGVCGMFVCGLEEEVVLRQGRRQ